MIVTALLVRWMGGWHDVTDAEAVTRWGRKEAMLGLGAVEELSEVETVSREQLVIFGDPLTEISCDTFPVGEPDTPYIAYRPGDTVTVPSRVGLPPAPERVQSITVTMDDDGRVTYATELRHVLMDERERFAENLTKLANGSIGGYSKVAQPMNMPPPRRERTTLEPPNGGGAGFAVQSVHPFNGFYSSDVLRHAPPGDGTYRLTAFRVMPGGYGPVDGPLPFMELWQHVPGGDGNQSKSHCTLGFNYQPSVFYHGGADVDIVFDAEWGISFRAENIPTEATATAVFEDGQGATVTVEWEAMPPELRVHTQEADDV